MTSDIRLMSEEEIRFLIDNIIEEVNEKLDNSITYDYGRLRDSLIHFWYYNNKRILELYDDDIWELLFDNDTNTTIDLLVDKIKSLIN